MPISTDIDHGDEGIDTERVCQDCPVVIVPDNHYPFRRRCYSCAILALGDLVRHHTAPIREE